MTAKFTIQRADESHSTAIQKLWKDIFRIVNTDARYEWLYRSPATYPITFVAIENSSNEIAGIASLYVNKYQHDTRTVKLGIAADFAVIPKYRVFGPARELQHAITNVVKSDEVDFILAYPNKKALKLMVSCGYVSIAGTHICIRYQNSGKMLASKFSNRVLGILISAGYWCYKKIVSVIPEIISRRLSVIKPNDAGEFDKLLQVYHPREMPASRMTKVKDKEYLVWRYFNNPMRCVTPLFIMDTAGKTRFVVFITLSGNMLSIVDILGAGAFLQYARVIACVTRYAKQAGVDTINAVFTAGAIMRYAFYVNGFISKKYDRELLVYPGNVGSSFLNLSDRAPVFEADMDI